MHKEFKKILKTNTLALENSAMDFQAMYDIMFNQPGVFCEDTDGFRIREISFSEMKDMIERASFALHKKAGSGNYIALAMENSCDFIVAFWAILRSGNKPYLVNLRHPKHLSERILKTLSITYAVTNTDFSFLGECIDIASLKGEKGSFNAPFGNEMALSTSATSLKDVICVYTGKELSNQILNVKGFIKKHPEIATGYKGVIKNLAFLPFYHIFGLIAVYFWFSFFGQRIVFLKNYSPDTILKTCRKHKVTHVFAVPLLWHTIEKEVMKKVRLKGEKKEKQLKKALKFTTSLQNVFPHMGMKLSQKLLKEVTDELFGTTITFTINGGSYIRKEALEFFNGLGYNLHNGYGMSELGITSVELRTKPKYKNLNSIGRPFSSVKYVIDDNGMLLVKGSSTCKRLIVEGKEIPMEEYFPTGDKMEVRENDYYILGRAGDIIIGENGENINPDAIEQGFSLPDAVNFSVLGIDDKITMVVQISPYLSQGRKNALIERVYEKNNSLPITTRVQSFYFTQDLITPPTAVKVGRKYLINAIHNGSVKLSPFSSVSSENTSSTSYSQELLEAVCAVVGDVLNVDKNSLDIHANIMLDMGASSMDYFAILTRLGEMFSLSGAGENEYRYTIDEFCQYIERYM